MGITEYIGGSEVDFEIAESAYGGELLREASYDSARNFVQSLRTWGRLAEARFVAEPWFRWFYRYEYRFDMYPVTVDRKFKAWDFKNFAPSKSWTARSELNFVILSFRSEEDLFLFKMAVL